MFIQGRRKFDYFYSSMGSLKKPRKENVQIHKDYNWKEWLKS